MNESLENIDQLFKDELENFSPELPPLAWDNISQGLNARKKKNIRAIIYKVAAGVAIFIAAGSLIAYVFSSKNPAINETTVSETSALSTLQNIEVTSSDISTEQNYSTSNIINTETPDSEGSSVLQNPAGYQDDAANENIAPVILAFEETAKTENTFDIRSIQKIDALVETSLPEENIKIKPAPVKDDYIDFAQYEQVDLDEKVSNSSWMVGGQAGPQYSYREINSQKLSDELLARFNDSENGVMAYAGGVNVEFSPVKRLSIQSGIHYSKMGQQKYAEMNVINTPVGVTQQNNPEFQETEALSYKVVNSTGNIVFNNISTPDNNALDNTADFIPGAPPGGPLATSFNNTATENVSLSQYFEYIEVPLIARYSIIDRKFGVHLLGGVSTNFLVGSSVYQNNDLNTSVAQTNSVAPVNYSSTVGFGLGYTMNDNLKITLEPQLKYFLNAQSSINNITVNPYSLGVMTGIKYLF